MREVTRPRELIAWPGRSKIKEPQVEDIYQWDRHSLQEISCWRCKANEQS